MSVPEVMSKSAFAKHMKVSKAAVTHWLNNGIITDAAIVGEGRTAKLKTAVAEAQVQSNRDHGQATGNGLATGSEAQATAPDPIESADDKPSFRDELQIEALKSMRLANDQAMIRAMKSQGELVSAGEVQAEMNRIAADMMTLFESTIAGMAGSIARRFSLPERDVRHALDAEFKAARAKIATRERSAAAAMSEMMEVEAA